MDEPAGGPLRVLGEQLLEQRGVDRARAQGVHADALAGELHAQFAGHGEDAALGGRVGDLGGGRAHPRHEGRGVDDGAPALAAHVRDGGLAAQVDGGEVDLLDPLPGLQAGLQDGVVVGRGDAGVVEGDVDAAVGVVRRLEQRLDLLGVGDVDLDEEPADLVGGGFAAGFVDVGADDLRALGGEAAGGGEADAAAGSGDDGGTADQAAANGGVGHCAGPSVLMKTFLVSVKAVRASGPSSRPRPDCLKPPKGVQ